MIERTPSKRLIKTNTRIAITRDDEYTMIFRRISLVTSICILTSTSFQNIVAYFFEE